MKGIVTNAVILLVLSLSAVSCDFIRTVAGRPTSSDIEAKRVEMEKTEALRQAREDSLLMVEKAAEDSLAATAAIAQEKITLINASKVVSNSREPLPSRYYIVLGSFQDAANAAKLAERVSAEGFNAETIRFKSGSTAVGVMPSDNIAAAYKALNEAKKHDFCPAEAWILINDK